MTAVEAGIPRRRFLQLAAVAGGAMLVPVRFAGRAQAAQQLWPGSAIPQFQDPLPIPQVVDLTGDGSATTVFVREFRSQVLPVSTGRTTWCWGYRTDDGPVGASDTQAETYIGPVVVARRGHPTQITWVNRLGEAASTNVVAYRDAVDQTLHWADPDEVQPGDPAEHHTGPIPAVVHLHGGEVPPEVDGGPEAWCTSAGQTGTQYWSKGTQRDRAVYAYPNTQEAAPLWFHDHTLGATRLNVFAGLAGGYVLTDPPVESQDPRPPVLPPLVPLVIQDRMFDTQGQLLFPAGVPYAPNPDEHPYWVPEFVGDTIVVNGRVWPRLAVERKRARFLLLNGSNARTYELFLTDPVTKVDGPPMWVIASDGGYLDAPARIDPRAAKPAPQHLVLMPGERYEVIVDFADPAWRRANPDASGRLLLKNVAKTPFPNGAAPAGSTVGRVLQLDLVGGTGPDPSYDPAADTGLVLRRGRPVERIAATTPDRVRQLTLNEVMGPGGPVEVLLNNRSYDAPVSEVVEEGTTELWELVNLTADAHPVHLHLAQFQIRDRQSFDLRTYAAAYAAAFPGGTYAFEQGPPLPYDPGVANAPLGGNPDVTPFLRGAASPPPAHESGWKDTVVAYPGQVTRIVVRWAPTDVPAGTRGHFPFDPSGKGDTDRGYVWHCHILDHEDNEMMRPTTVRAEDVVRTVTDY